MTDKNGNIYVFLSHSHHDYEKVSRLRNILEEEGFKPLMFFLKAFENPKFEHLLKPIIKEEIDQRQRFILCRSENTKESAWVKFEEDYIKSKKRAYEVVDLDSPLEVQKNAIRNYRRRSRVFISYQRSLSLNLLSKLEERGFVTFVDASDIRPGELFIDAIVSNIEKAANDGYILYLINSDSWSDWHDRELLYALELSARIVPIWVKGEELNYKTVFILRDKTILDVRNLPQDEQVCRIVKHLVDYDLQFNEE
ncbi:MAG: toll/interleukin-1 receptor domain-containing protein [Alistipes sp.]|nr:toll/interleukin-1 receptor domain-containing protein [Alistipes sp.]